MLHTDGLIPAPDYEWLSRQPRDAEVADEEWRSRSKAQIVKKLGSSTLAIMTLVPTYTNLLLNGIHHASIEQESFICEPASETELQQTHLMLAENRDVEDVLNTGAIAEHDYRAQEDAWYEAKGEAWGVTVPGYRSVFADLNDEVTRRAETNTTGREYLDRTNAFLDQYGVGVSIDATDLSPVGSAIGADEVDDIVFKRRLMEIIEAFGSLPIELLKAMDTVHRVVIQHSAEMILPDGEPGMPAGQYNPLTKTIYLTYGGNGNDRVYYDRSTMSHELGHAINTALNCGQNAWFYDPAFERLNPDNIYKARGAEPANLQGYVSADIEDAQREFYEVRDEILQSVKRGDSTQAEQKRSDALELGESFITHREYSRSNPEEDKADVYTDILESLNFAQAFTSLNTDSEEFPVLSAKRQELLNRLRRAYPEAAAYMGDVLAEPDTLDELWYYNRKYWQVLHPNPSDAD